MPKSKRSGPALKVLQTAQTSFQSKLSGLHVNEFSQTTWEDARQGILDTEAHMAARGSLRNTRRLMPLFEGLHHYSKVIEVLCNGVPFMPLVWAPIKFIVNVSLTQRATSNAFLLLRVIKSLNMLYLGDLRERQGIRQDHRPIRPYR